MKILCVVGARPNFMKAAPVIEALKAHPSVSVVLVHTGQHYDRKMSELFFEQLGMPQPDINLNVGSGPHGQQTGQIMIKFEPLLGEQRPDLVMVFGDVNSTIAAALCAAKMGIKIAHVEAGLRSFDRGMPEEINRVLTDHISDYLFVTEPSGQQNLRAEGVPDQKVHFVGNVMVDTLLKHLPHARQLNVAQQLGFAPKGYGILTLHRPSNVDDPKVLRGILETVYEISRQVPIVFPCHPRTRQHFERIVQEDKEAGGKHFGHSGVTLIDPLGYLEFLSLTSSARILLTDSGGIQEESTVLGVPCLTLRENTERPVTIHQGTNVLVGTSRENILTAAAKALQGGPIEARRPDLWDGQAAKRIASILASK